MDFNCCYTRSKKPVKKSLDKPRKCAATSCITITTPDLLYKWRPVIAGTNIYRFCSDKCWAEWLLSSIQTTPLIDTSPVTPAIMPYTHLEEIPMLNI